jgi:hypothetical protein
MSYCHSRKCMLVGKKKVKDSSWRKQLLLFILVSTKAQLGFGMPLFLPFWSEQRECDQWSNLGMPLFLVFFFFFYLLVSFFPRLLKSEILHGLQTYKNIRIILNVGLFSKKIISIPIKKNNRRPTLSSAL